MKSLSFLDPYNAHLKPANAETVNAVADVLRQFFRQLEAPLVPTEFQPELYNICERYRQSIYLFFISVKPYTFQLLEVQEVPKLQHLK